MKITFLGTGTSQGVPIIGCKCNICSSDDPKDKRLRSSVHIQTERTSIVIDSGPDFRQQMLREQIDRLDAILFTHEHKDHIAGLDDVRAFNFIQKKPMDIYGNENVIHAIKREFAYAFAEFKYPGVPKINENLISEDQFKINELDIQVIHTIHYKLPILCYRINDFVYITDTNYISEEEKQKIKGAKVLVVNALRKEDHISHFSLQQALDLIAEAKPERAFLTHMSHNIGKHQDLILELPKGVEPAYDGLSIDV